ncbi:unnamed protein product [Effrenium voratum]|uniref:Uncharacterized protein n=1 Tax=Effrenium voratum TaxID=2562239 RepID=A0AA36IHH8_9DINO|nr:unnamed protein product [Effrenium voratum]CAJ1387420.1 unnamed protein product [Effrenium voratum]|mmetsp:Transcript_40841/g.97356  ORF Transcript_40841/g.97356 Transcript_40841/m.97356 type:complete len:221 (+) Transcript_40841:69-731(+)
MDRITAPTATTRLTSPPSSPASWLRTNTGPMFPTDREAAIRGDRPRYEWVYDPPIFNTHDKLNGVLKTQLDAWHCPKTSGTQHVLHASSHIVDTVTRQRIARFYNDSFLRQTGKLVSTHDPLANKPLGGGVTICHDGTLRPGQRLQRCSSAPGSIKADQYLPPWIERSKYELALSKAPPNWSGLPFAATGHRSGTPHNMKKFEKSMSLSSSGLPTFPKAA